jgi:hypothetical protein
LFPFYTVRRGIELKISVVVQYIIVDESKLFGTMLKSRDETGNLSDSVSWSVEHLVLPKIQPGNGSRPSPKSSYLTIDQI